MVAVLVVVLETLLLGGGPVTGGEDVEFQDVVIEELKSIEDVKRFK